MMIAHLFAFRILIIGYCSWSTPICNGVDSSPWCSESYERCMQCSGGTWCGAKSTNAPVATPPSKGKYS